LIEADANRASLSLKSNKIEFNSPIIRYEDIIIHPGYYGYLEINSVLFRHKTEVINYYQVESDVKFSSGNVSDDEDYNNKYKSKFALITTILDRYIAKGFGMWPSNQPESIKYFPTSQTNTSNIVPEIGTTQENSQPTLNAMWLSMSEGAGWEYTDFPKSSAEATNVYSGMTFEVSPAPYKGRNDGTYTLSVEYIVDQYSNIPFTDIWCESIGITEKSITAEQVIMLDNRF
jgi:hypothetical protein